MAFLFPSNPTLNQTYTFNSITWVFNGKGWGKLSTSGASVTASATAPGSPTDGAMWLENESGDLYVYGGGNWILTGVSPGPSFSGSYNDLTDKPTITTVSPSAISDQANTSTGYFNLPAGTTAQRPATAYTGATRLNTTTNYVEMYNGTAWVSLLYVGLLTATYTGATVSYSGNFAILTYTSTGTFNVTNAPVGATIDYLVVAGGGGGGSGGYGGGGGGGGYLTGAGVTVSATNYTITVGSGGATNTQGGNSAIAGTGFTTVTAIGGGSGGAAEVNGGNGGSGGGAGGTGSSGNKFIGKGVYPGSTYTDAARQGYDGGEEFGQNAVGPAGGGGGAGGIGGAASANIAGNGGVGLPNAITGLYYAGGGGGGTISGTAGTAGLGGGGAGSASTTGGTGTVNTGGGGGGGGGNSAGGGAGGSGVVVIKYRFQ
jgi:hypothetical protein